MFVILIRENLGNDEWDTNLLFFEGIGPGNFDGVTVGLFTFNEIAPNIWIVLRCLSQYETAESAIIVVAHLKLSSVQVVSHVRVFNRLDARFTVVFIHSSYDHIIHVLLFTVFEP